MPIYLVGSKDSTLDLDAIRVVYAQNKEEAAEKFVRAVTINQEIFLEAVYERSFLSALAETFWRSTSEVVTTFVDEQAILADEDGFQTLVREFFADRQDYADLYLQHFYCDGEEKDTPPNFPEDMLMCFARNTSWACVVIPLTSIEQIS